MTIPCMFPAMLDTKYRCRERQNSICKGCSTRLVREWNQAGGIS